MQYEIARAILVNMRARLKKNLTEMEKDAIDHAIRQMDSKHTLDNMLSRNKSQPVKSPTEA